MPQQQHFLSQLPSCWSQHVKLAVLSPHPDFGLLDCLPSLLDFGPQGNTQISSIGLCISRNSNWTFCQVYLGRFRYLFGVLRSLQHCTGHIMMGSWKGRGNQYIQFVRALYCKLLTNGKQLPAFPLEALPGTEPQPQRWEVRVLPLCHCGHFMLVGTPIGLSTGRNSNWTFYE